MQTIVEKINKKFNKIYNVHFLNMNKYSIKIQNVEFVKFDFNCNKSYKIKIKSLIINF